MKLETLSIDASVVRKAVVALALGSASVNLSAQEADRTPAPVEPTNSSYEVRKAVYSTTAAEIFWSAHPDPDATYTLTRDGVVIQEFSVGRSYFDANLSANTGYTYCLYVTANRVQLSSGLITLFTPDDGSGDVPSPITGSCPSMIPLPPGATPLTSSVYSGTAVEIFWSRDQNPEATYNLFRDGILLTKNSTGTSYFDDNLQPNSQYTYCLYDIVNDTVTDAEAITVTTRDNGSGEEPMPPAGTCPSDPIGGGGVGPIEPPITVGPLNLKAVTYSQTSLEIFWDRAPSPDVLYNVFRDGELVLANSRANSFYESNLRPGSTIVYSVTGGANGNMSTSAAVTVGTPTD